MSISSLLFTARDSLITHQLAIDVTGSNIANVDTPGYSQQRVEFTSLGSVNIAANTAQIGVTIERISRIYDGYIESQLITQQQNSGYSETMLKGLENIEVIIDDTSGGGLNEQLNNFWAAWESLSQNPSGEIERNALYSASESLVNTIQYYKENLDYINTEINSSIRAVVSQINDKISEVADLNSRIVSVGENRGDNNDLLDKRAEALKELSTMIDLNYYENDDGSINVYMSNGQPLLQGPIGQTLSVALNTEGYSEIYNSNVSGESMNNAILKGKLGAFLELQNESIPAYIQYLNEFATALTARVNELHSTGYDAYQNTGIDFFEITDTNNAAGTIKINDIITEDANRIAASASVTGDGEKASQIASIQEELILDGNTSTLNNFLSAMVGLIGHQVSTAETYNDHQSIILTHLTNRRDAVSGVSIDEEMIKLVKYQMGYTAAAKLCSTVDSLLDELMGIIS
ncbi:MAG: flagellar hook-associated protein FlgK [Deltaproteobacteria bacterium]|nr:flagellar hook-associated protein FlgK [Deltaproteobacteria bacterium]